MFGIVGVFGVFGGSVEGGHCGLDGDDGHAGDGCSDALAGVMTSVFVGTVFWGEGI